ncbi:MAG: NAD(P)/FAD-dependent oxidoreductase, partial [Pseudomonadota bacterium]
MDLNSAEKIVVLGGGQAGAQSVISLRQWGYEGDIKLICEEAAPPYQRPPLSKAYLKGEMPEERLYFKPLDWYAEQNIEVRVSLRGEAIDRSVRRVALSDGSVIDYDALILATGSRPRPLPAPGAELEGVHDLRTLADVETLAPNFAEGRRLVIVGAGYIGLECAAVARAMGMEVTVLEMAPRVLQRVAGSDISAFYERVHRDNGVDIRTATRLQALEGDATR